jgi:hypothetical protein
MSIEESLVDGANWIAAGGVSILGISALGLIRKENKKRKLRINEMVSSSTKHLEGVYGELFLLGVSDPEVKGKVESILESAENHLSLSRGKDLSRCSSYVRRNYLSIFGSIREEVERLNPEIFEEYSSSLKLS